MCLGFFSLFFKKIFWLQQTEHEGKIKQFRMKGSVRCYEELVHPAQHLATVHPKAPEGLCTAEVMELQLWKLKLLEEVSTSPFHLQRGRN